MYIGRRDPEIRIIVPQTMCNEYISKSSGELYIEIATPPESVDEYQYKWGTLMVRPEQVYSIGNGFNCFLVNDQAQIQNSVKNENKQIISYELITPNQIIGRWLKYYRWVHYRAIKFIDFNQVNSETLFYDMKKMGQTMEVYMNRLPLQI